MSFTNGRYPKRKRELPDEDEHARLQKPAVPGLCQNPVCFGGWAFLLGPHWFPGGCGMAEESEWQLAGSGASGATARLVILFK